MAKAKPKRSKVCPSCGLSFTERKKWTSRGHWEQIVYCSERCRRASKSVGG